MNRTHVRSGGLRLAALLVAGLGLVALPATLGAQAPALGGGMRVAEATVYAGGVDFLPSVRHGGGVVTVSGGGLQFQQKIAAGRSATITPFDPEGQLLPDGVYTWELELYPDAATAKKLRAAAAKNGGRAPGAWERESGTFAIRYGLVVNRDLVEAAPVRPAATVQGVHPASAAARPAGPAVDDDSAVGSREGVEAEMKAAAPAARQLAPANRPISERSDAAALAMGGSLEAALAPAAGGPAVLRNAQPGEAQATRNYLISNTANGRPDSRKQR